MRLQSNYFIIQIDEAMKLTYMEKDFLDFPQFYRLPWIIRNWDLKEPHHHPKVSPLLKFIIKSHLLLF